MKNDKVALAFGAVPEIRSHKVDQPVWQLCLQHQLKTGKLSFGLRAGVDLSNTDYTGLLLNDPDDPVFKTADQAWRCQTQGRSIYYNDRYFAGLSVSRFPEL
jgi:hypothetical protein